MQQLALNIKQGRSVESQKYFAWQHKPQAQSQDYHYATTDLQTF